MTQQTNQEKIKQEYQQTNSVILNLESLTTQYQNLLIQYQQAVSNYVNFVQQEAVSQSNTNIGSKPLTSIQGSTYWGSSTVGQNNSSTVQECQASCAIMSSCTGATFNATDNGQPMCWLRGGDGDISSGSPNDYAIVPESKELLQIIQNTNQQLISVNQQIQEQSDKGEPLYDKESGQRKLKNAELINQYIQLTEERNKINDMLTEYKSLDSYQEQGSILINKNYYSFILLLGLVIAFIFVLYKFGLSSSGNVITSSQSIQSGGELGTNAYYIVGVFILILLIIKFIQ